MVSFSQRCAVFDMVQMLPVGHIVFVHRRAPAEDVVADEEVVHHANNHRDERDAEKDTDLMINWLMLTPYAGWPARSGSDHGNGAYQALIATPTSTWGNRVKMMSDVPRIDQYCQRCGQ